MKGLREPTILYYTAHLEALLEEWGGTPMPSWSRLMFDRYLGSRRKKVAKKASKLTRADRAERSSSRAQVYVDSREPISPNTKRKIIQACKRFIKWARARGFDCPDFVGDEELPKLPKVRNKATLTLEQLVAVLDAARDHKYLEVPIALSSFAALGEGDIISLDWREVDLKAGVITRAEGRRKTGEDLRVPMTPQLREVLSRAFLQQGRPKRGRVCSRAPNSMQTALRRLEAKAGAPKAPARQGGFHRYRRSCNTILMKLGVPQPVRAAILAHAPGSLMTGEYDDVRLEDAAAAMKKLSDAFEKARQA